MATSKLPVRKTVEPLFRMVSEMEKEKSDRAPPVPPHGRPDKKDGKQQKIYSGKRSRSAETRNNRKNETVS
jgi:hypothetical protein